MALPRLLMMSLTVSLKSPPPNMFSKLTTMVVKLASIWSEVNCDGKVKDRVARH